MMIPFFKYQGTGNDFVMIDNRAKIFPKEKTDIISQLCDRNFGIGADGVILIEDDINFDFKMVYYNVDGSQTFCGNGGRCVVAFAENLGIIKDKTTFLAFDGEHYAEIKDAIVSLKMIDVDTLKVKENAVFVYTGTQHHVEIVENLDEYPVYDMGKKIRYTYPFPGSNVNFVEQVNDKKFKVRTYEKGVENETLACGTGVTAVAIAMHKTKRTDKTNIELPVLGGSLSVSFTNKNGLYSNVFLTGPANFVFKGEVNI